jgi:acyl phosphate:glycerol-3-phosphate acyltransferase
VSAAAAVAWLLASYLLGAVPTSYLAARLFRGIDLREHGSRNLGATNLYRVLGWRYAVPVGLFDAVKGAIPVLVFAPRISSSQLVALLCGVVAIVGHVFSVFVRFRGGKGVATAAGVMLALTPVALGVAAVVWAVLVYLTGYVSVGSIAAAAVFPVAVYLLEPPDQPGILWVDVLVAAAIIWFHRANIRRLLQGTENRFGRRAAPPARP